MSEVKVSVGFQKHQKLELCSMSVDGMMGLEAHEGVKVSLLAPDFSNAPQH